MLCPYIRSSSINQFKSCEMKYTLEYLFGFKSKSGKKASLGTIFHKVMELRAQASKAIACDYKFIIDDNFGQMKVSEALNLTKSLALCFGYYKDIESHIVFDDKKDMKTIAGWIEKTLSDYSSYDPINLDIIDTEVFFDFEIKKPWAAYKSVIDGVEFSGNLRIKGTMDSVVRLSDSVYELVDFKTGALRSDFATGEEKTLEYLQNDVQLLLYLIALTEIYPDKHFILTLFYINNGGLFSVAADDDMLGRAWKMLEKTYKQINKTYNPSQLDATHKDWRCKYCCDFSKPYKNGLSMCQFMKKEMREKSFGEVSKEYVKASGITTYGSGGGRTCDSRPTT